MITNLTSEQEAMFPHYIDRWTKIGLSTDPIDRVKHDAAIAEVYKLAKLQPPRMIYVPCPLSGALAASIYQSKMKQDGQAMDSAVISAVESAVISAVHSAVSTAVISAVDSAVDFTVDFTVNIAVESAVDFTVNLAVDLAVSSAVRFAVGTDVESAVISAVNSAVNSAVHSAVDSAQLKWVHWLWGNQWSGYGAWGEFFKNECSVDVNAACLAMMEHGHYIWPFKKVCFASEKPVQIHLDDMGRSHSETGPAVLYGSGWGPYAWHGTNVPAEWIEDNGALTPEIALTHENIERRRAACEILGWHNILDKLNATSVDRDADEHIGELLEVDIPDIGREKFLKVLCGTGRTFALPVPPNMTTALEANAWTQGFDDPLQFITPEIRT